MLVHVVQAKLERGKLLMKSSDLRAHLLLIIFLAAGVGPNLRRATD